MLSFEISPDVAALVEALNGVAPGGQIKFSDLDAAIGRSVRQYPWLLQSARRIAARDHGAVFGNVRGVGLQRLTTEQLPKVGHTARNRIRSAARRGVKFISQGLSRANDVAPDTQRKLNAEVSALSLIEHISRDAAAKPVASHDTRPEPVGVMAQRLFGTVAS